MATITAPDRAFRYVTASILLPESDMASWLKSSRSTRTAAPRPHYECVTHGERRGGPLGTRAATEPQARPGRHDWADQPGWPVTPG
jgi:hypothetical protein